MGKVTLPARRCAWCGAAYMPRVGTQRYHAPDCARAAAQQQSARRESAPFTALPPGLLADARSQLAAWDARRADLGRTRGGRRCMRPMAASVDGRGAA